MVKKLSLKIDYSNEYSFIGISCHLKDYRLSFFINQYCGLQLKKIDDFTQQSAENKSLSYPLFYYHSQETDNRFYLISNHHSEMKLIPALKQFDYFLLIQKNMQSEQKKELIAKLKKTQNLLAAYEIELNKIKNVNQFMAELELQLIDYLKKYSE